MRLLWFSTTLTSLPMNVGDDHPYIFTVWVTSLAKPLWTISITYWILVFKTVIYRSSRVLCAPRFLYTCFRVRKSWDPLSNFHLCSMDWKSSFYPFSLHLISTLRYDVSVILLTWSRNSGCTYVDFTHYYLIFLRCIYKYVILNVFYISCTLLSYILNDYMQFLWV